MTGQIDYETVGLPEDEAYENWHYTARRAYILQEIHRLGHPKRLRQVDLAHRFDVSQATISRDIDALAEYVDESIGERRTLTTAAVMERCVAGLLEEGKYCDAARIQLEWDQWVHEQHTIADLRDELSELRAMINDDDETPGFESGTSSYGPAIGPTLGSEAPSRNRGGDGDRVSESDYQQETQ